MAVVWLEKLLKLQEIDLRLRDLEARLRLLPREMSDMVAKRDALAAATKAAQDAARKVELAVRSGESGIESLQRENLKLQQQSALVKNNKEYQAMLAAIEQNKLKIGELEERTILLMDDLDAARKSAAKVASDNAAATAALKAEFDELFAFSSEVKKEIAKLQAARPEFLHEIDADTLRQYNVLLGGRTPSTPVVEVENGICGNCHLKVTPQTLNLLRRGDVATCDNCQHFIYDAVVCGIRQA
ncbi:MAG: hypothetical protein IJJ28_02140 [Lentisphaeria bacterium]|nr:hypothetical protein [Lentisphaeria bacterium]